MEEEQLERGKHEKLMTEVAEARAKVLEMKHLFVPVLNVSGRSTTGILKLISSRTFGSKKMLSLKSCFPEAM
jgi:hypothetical protein